MSTSDLLTVVCLAVGGSIAAGAGLGGGGVVVPVLILVAKFETHNAVPLSNAFLFGVGVFNVVQLSRRRHPLADRPVIDFWLSFVMIPPKLAGTVFGVLLNSVMPNWSILVILIVLLGITAWRTLASALRMWRADHRRTRRLFEDDKNDNVVVDNRSPPVSIALTSPTTAPEAPVVRDPRALAELISDEQSMPSSVVLGECIALVVVVMLSMARGGERSSGAAGVGVTPCSAAYWLLVLAPLPLFGTLAALVARHLVALHAYKCALGYTFVAGDIRWSRNNATLVVGTSFAVGVVGALVGIGGGLVCEGRCLFFLISLFLLSMADQINNDNRCLVR